MSLIQKIVGEDEPKTKNKKLNYKITTKSFSSKEWKIKGNQWKPISKRDPWSIEPYQFLIQEAPSISS